jgi:hypothetical protein
MKRTIINPLCALIVLAVPATMLRPPGEGWLRI